MRERSKGGGGGGGGFEGHGKERWEIKLKKGGMFPHKSV